MLLLLIPGCRAAKVIDPPTLFRLVAVHVSGLQHKGTRVRDATAVWSDVVAYGAVGQEQLLPVEDARPTACFGPAAKYVELVYLHFWGPWLAFVSHRATPAKRIDVSAIVARPGYQNPALQQLGALMGSRLVGTRGGGWWRCWRLTIMA